MDKIFSKLGLYDVIGVWFAGVIILMTSAILDSWMLTVDYIKLEYLKNPIVLIAGGYFMGMVFQELGNFIHRHLFQKNQLYLRNILDEKHCDKPYTSLTKSEIEGIRNLKYFKTTTFVLDKTSHTVKKCTEYKNDEFIYNFCKNRVSKSNMGGEDKNQAVAATSRSLAVYFALAAMVSVILAIGSAISSKCCSQNCCRILIIFIISFFLSVVFFYRSNRFIKLRYIQYLRAFYYSEIDPKI